MSSPEAHNVYDGYICNYNVEYPDHYMIAPGALKSSDNVPIAYTLENSSPEFIGSAKLESDSCGMLAHCQFYDNYAGLVDLLKSGACDLGFTAIKVKYTTDDKGVKHYTQGTIRNVGILPYTYNPRVKPEKQKKAKPDINSEELLSKIRWRGDGHGYEVYMYIKPIIDEMLGKESEDK